MLILLIKLIFIIIFLNYVFADLKLCSIDDLGTDITNCKNYKRNSKNNLLLSYFLLEK